MSAPRHSPWAEHGDFAIGLKPIPVAAWLEGGEERPDLRKDALFAQSPRVVWGETPASREAQGEVLSLVAGAVGAGAEAGDRPPLMAAARMVADDLCLMEKRDGAWRLTALSLCAPTFFSVPEVLGKSLGDLHGPVPAFGERFLTRVERIFEGLREDVVLERRNWTLVNSPEPHAPDPGPMRQAIAAIAPEDAGRALYTRVERQTLRRLPATGGALFTIRIWLEPLDALTGSPDRLAAFAEAWARTPEAFRAYKRLDLYDPLVASFLRAAGETYSVNGTGSAS
jgi:hypothetical protein